MNEPRMIFLGAIEKTDRDESVAFDLPDGPIDPEVLQAAIERINLERAQKRAEESKRIHAMFGVAGDTKGR